MKKFVAIILAALLLTGCHRQEQSQEHSVVTRISVTCYHHGQMTRRSYQQEESMRPILNALRQLGHRFQPDVDPESLNVRTFCITLVRSDGTRQLYCIKENAFIRENRGPWQQTDPKKLQELMALLQFLPGDSV